MTKAEVKKELKEKNTLHGNRIVDWNWGLWESDKAVTIISISQNHVVYMETYYLCEDGYMKYLKDCTKCM